MRCEQARPSSSIRHRESLEQKLGDNFQKCSAFPHPSLWLNCPNEKINDRKRSSVIFILRFLDWKAWLEWVINDAWGNHCCFLNNSTGLRYLDDIAAWSGGQSVVTFNGSPVHYIFSDFGYYRALKIGWFYGFSFLRYCHKKDFSNILKWVILFLSFRF